MTSITELQALAKSGLAYSKDIFDQERYKRLVEISAHLMAVISLKDYPIVLDAFEKEEGYITPKVALRGAIFQNDKILLVQEQADGLWSLPGGWADVNLSASENMLKEIQEETGFICVIDKLIAVLDKRKTHGITKWPHVYKIFFLCKIKSSQPDFHKHEILDIGFFDQHHIPPLSTTRTTLEQIHMCFKHYNHPDLPSLFD